MAEYDLDMVIAEQNMIANHEEVWHQKYEKQLQAKDATIAALVGLLRLALRARSYVAHTNIWDAAWGKIEAAIKEATDAS